MKTKKRARTNKERATLAKKISRDFFLECDTRTRVPEDKKAYSRKEKHKKPLI